jgi:competence ComEA-like helix-hairpin-helix protein
MSKAFNELIEKRQQQIRARDRQMRLLWLLLAVAAVVVVAISLLRPDPSTGPINVNTASVEQLSTLPEVGAEIAKRIVAARPFAKPEDLLQVKGIGEKTLEKMKPRLVFPEP